MSKKMIVSAVAMALLATNAFADGHCASGKTLEKGKFTIATGNPAYFPWVLDDAPESGQGFEAAVAYAVAEEMGFSKQDVVWVSDLHLMKPYSQVSKILTSTCSNTP